MSKLKNILSNLDQNLLFVSKGDFFSRFSEFSLTKSKTLKVSKASIARISRFNQEDFQDYILNEYPDYKILLFSDDIFFKKAFKDRFDYIERSSEFKNFPFLLKIFPNSDILFIQINFNSIKIFKYKDNALIELFNQNINTISERDTGTYINNVLFDPFATDTFTNDDLKEFFKVIRKNSNKSTIILGGEYVWLNKYNRLFKNLVYNAELKNNFIIFDKFGLYEAIASAGSEDTFLAFLDKTLFTTDLLVTEMSNSAIKPDTISDIYLFKPSYYDKYKVSVFMDKDENKNEITFANSAINTRRIVAYENLKDFKKASFSFLDDSSTLILQRRDFMFENIDNSESRLEFNRVGRVGIKIFDVVETNSLSKIEPEVIEKSIVRKGDLLCRYKKFGSLLEQKVFAPINGRVLLKYLNLGYIFIEETKEDKNSFNSLCRFKIRPRLILGKDFTGFFNKDIKYVSYLNKDSFHKSIQTGAQAIIARTIEKDFFFVISKLKLNNLATIAILEGIDVPVLKNQFIFQQLSGEIAVNFSIDKNYLTFYTTSNTFSNLCSSYFVNIKYRKGSIIRLIHDKYWGEQAIFLKNLDGSRIIVKSKHFSQVNILNID